MAPPAQVPLISASVFVGRGQGPISVAGVPFTHRSTALLQRPSSSATQVRLPVWSRKCSAGRATVCARCGGHPARCQARHKCWRCYTTRWCHPAWSVPGLSKQAFATASGGRSTSCTFRCPPGEWPTTGGILVSCGHAQPPPPAEQTGRRGCWNRPALCLSFLSRWSPIKGCSLPMRPTVPGSRGGTGWECPIVNSPINRLSSINDKRHQKNYSAATSRFIRSRSCWLTR